MEPLARRIAGFPTTVFSEFSALAQQHGAVNLGQGFPDFDGPPEVKQAAIRAIEGAVNQYAVGSGAPALRQAIARHARRFYGQELDPDAMVSVTSGATEALFDAIVGTVNPGDEVILFEPFYDSYEASVRIAGGEPRFVLLRPPDEAHPAWWFEDGELERAFSPRTRMIVVNTPHNPTGKVFTRAELARIAALARKHDAIVLSDEVYEHIAFTPHLRPATLPELADRTITVSSAGKSFSLTGWKIGWAIAPPGLRKAVQQTHQFVTFATASPLQAAIATALELPDAYFQSLQRDYLRKRDLLSAGLSRAGFRVFPVEGSYFALVDLAQEGVEDDFSFCRQLITETGVAAIPVSAFYGEAHKAFGRRFARFAFCKTDPVLEAAVERLLKRRR